MPSHDLLWFGSVRPSLAMFSCFFTRFACAPLGTSLAPKCPKCLPEPFFFSFCRRHQLGSKCVPVRFRDLFQLLSPPAKRFRSSFCGHLPSASDIFSGGVTESNVRHQLGCKCLQRPSKLFSSFCGHLPGASDIFSMGVRKQLRHQLRCKCLPAPFRDLFQLLWPHPPSASDIFSRGVRQ